MKTKYSCGKIFLAEIYTFLFALDLGKNTKLRKTFHKTNGKELNLICEIIIY